MLHPRFKSNTADNGVVLKSTFSQSKQTYFFAAKQPQIFGNMIPLYVYSLLFKNELAKLTTKGKFFARQGGSFSPIGDRIGRNFEP